MARDLRIGHSGIPEPGSVGRLGAVVAPSVGPSRSARLVLGLLLAFLLALVLAWPLDRTRPAHAETSTARSVTVGQTRASDHFIVHSASAATAERTLSLAGAAWELLSPHFTDLPREPIVVVVVEDQDEYERVQPADMTRGFATFGGNLVYLRGLDLDQEVVTHEVAHILLGKNVRPGLVVPDWFNEGFAQFVSGADDRRREVFYLVASRRLPSLPELSRVDALKGPDRELPTVLGFAIVRFLVDEYGHERLWMLVDRLSEAKTFDQALFLTYDHSDLELSRQWAAYAEQEYGLLSLVGLETLGTIGMGLLALLATGAWIVTKIRLRRRSGSPHDLTVWELVEAEAADASLDGGAEAQEQGRDSVDGVRHL